MIYHTITGNLVAHSAEEAAYAPRLQEACNVMGALLACPAGGVPAQLRRVADHIDLLGGNLSCLDAVALGLDWAVSALCQVPVETANPIIALSTQVLALSHDTGERARASVLLAEKGEAMAAMFPPDTAIPDQFRILADYLASDAVDPTVVLCFLRMQAMAILQTLHAASPASGVAMARAFGDGLLG